MFLGFSILFLVIESLLCILRSSLYLGSPAGLSIRIFSSSGFPSNTSDNCDRSAAPTSQLIEP